MDGLLCHADNCYKPRYRGLFCRACYVRHAVKCAVPGCNHRVVSSVNTEITSMCGDAVQLCARHAIEHYHLSCRFCNNKITNLRHAVCHMHYMRCVYRCGGGSGTLKRSRDSGSSLFPFSAGSSSCALTECTSDMDSVVFDQSSAHGSVFLPSATSRGGKLAAPPGPAPPCSDISLQNTSSSSSVHASDRKQLMITPVAPDARKQRRLPAESPSAASSCSALSFLANDDAPFNSENEKVVLP